MISTLVRSNETEKTWNSTAPRHPIKPDHGLECLNTRLQTETTNANVTTVVIVGTATLPRGRIATNVTVAVNVTANGETTESETGDLVTGNDLMGTTTDVDAKIVARTSAKRVSYFLPTFSTPAVPSFPPTPAWTEVIGSRSSVTPTA